MNKVLIIGADGQLAFDLIRVLKKNCQIIKARHKDLDVVNRAKVEQFIKKHKPDIIINTAAFHKTQDCELNPEKSFKVNAIGAFNAARASAGVGARIIFISTDYVFDGNKKSFSEQDTSNPLNIYGASKLAGEILTKIANEKSYIIRTSWLFGIHKSGKGHDFVSLMLEKAKSEKEIKVVSDQFGCPTYTLDLALKIKELIDKKAPSGVYHLVGGGSCSWYNFAKKLFELAGVDVKLIPVDSSEFPSIVKRPKYSVLVSRNLKKIKINNLRPWPKALENHLQEMRATS